MSFTLWFLCAFASPILIHNVPENFVPIRYQWSHSMGSPHPGFIPFAEFVGVQLLLFGGVPFVVMVWGFRHWRNWRSIRVCGYVPASSCCRSRSSSSRHTRSAGRELGVSCFIACWPLAEVWYSRARLWRGWRMATRAGFALPLGLSAALTWHLFLPFPLIPPAQDRPYRQWARMDAARAAADDLRAGALRSGLRHNLPVGGVLRWQWDRCASD